MKRHGSFFRNQTLHSMIKMPITTPFMLLSNPSFNFGHVYAVKFKVTMGKSKLWKQGVIGISVEFSYLMEEPCRTVLSLTTKSSKRNFTTLRQGTFRILAYPTHFELPIWTNSTRTAGSTWFYVSYTSKVMEILYKHVIYKNRTAENEFNDLGIFWEKKNKDLRLNILHSKC